MAGDETSQNFISTVLRNLHSLCLFMPVASVQPPFRGGSSPAKSACLN